MRAGLFFALILAVPFIAQAQAIEDFASLGESGFTLSVSPEHPTPASQAIISINSTSLDLSRATVVALVSGKEVYRGSIRPFPITLGKAGSITTIRATVTESGVPYTETLTIQPQEVTLIAEPISSSPPLYQGKSGVPLEGQVRVVTIANLVNTAGQSASPSTYSYTWAVDDNKVVESSGIGKSTLIIDSPMLYRGREVSVVVTNAGGNLSGGASLSLSSATPFVRIYENDPLQGIRFDHALSGSYSITDAEATLYAAPFSFPTERGAPSVAWFLNGTSAQTGNSITLRPTGGGKGSASLSVAASAGELATASAVLNLLFGTSGSSFFGL